MSVKPIEELKEGFLPQTKPPYEQFSDLVDSLRHRSDKIPAQDIVGFEYLSAGIIGVYDDAQEPDDFALWDAAKTQRFLVSKTAAFTASVAWGSLTVTLSELQNNEVFFIHEANGAWVKYLNAKPIAKSAYDIYVETTSDIPIKSKAEWSTPPTSGNDGLPGANGGAEIKPYDPADAPFLKDLVVSFEGGLYQAKVTTSLDPKTDDWTQLGGDLTVMELPSDVLKFDKSYKKTLILTADTGQSIDLADAVDGSRVSLIVQTKGFKYFLPQQVVYNKEQLKLGTYTIDLLYNQGVIIANIVSTFPENAYFLESLEQSEIDKGAAISNYLVLRKDTIIQYPFTVTNRHNTMIDTSEALLDCYPNLATPTAHHTIFHQYGIQNCKFKFGVVKGDRTKREFTHPDEYMNEGTYLCRFDEGCSGQEFEGADISAFMGDAISGGGGGTRSLLFNNVDGYGMTEIGTTGVYQSTMLPLYPAEGDTIACYGGVGQTRFPNVQNAKFLFYNGATLLETRDTEYLQHQKRPATATHVVFQNSGISGGSGFFNLTIVLNPAHGMTVKNSNFRDFHRGMVSNWSNDTILVNCTYRNTAEYYLYPAFGDPTMYANNGEDVVANMVQMLNQHYEDKFHAVLFAAAQQFRIKDCTFKNNTYNITCYQIQKQSYVEGGIFIGGILLSEGNGAKGIVKFSGAKFINGAVNTQPDFEFTNCIMEGGILGRGEGSFHNNSVTEAFNDGGDYRGIKNNTFTDGPGEGYINPVNPDGYAIVPANIFINQPFKSNGAGTYLHVGGTYSYDNSAIVYEVGHSSLQTRIFYNAQLTGMSMVQTRYGGTDLGSHFFYNCEIDLGVALQFFLAYNNTPGTVHNSFYFKNCIITSATAKWLVVYSFSGVVSEYVFDNCTIDPNIKFDFMTPTYAHVVNRVRYIRVYGTGSVTDPNSIDFRAIEAYEHGSAVDVCLGKTAKANGAALTGITDGSLSVVSIATAGKETFLEIDLGSIVDIETINVKRIVGRTYHGSRVVFAETSDLDAEVVVSNATDYVEIIGGLDVEF